MTISEQTDPEGPIGPTFGDIPREKRPQPQPACATCPKAMWYRTAKHMRAFCRELRLITWEDDEKEPILQCDGREAALMPPYKPAS